MTEGIEAIGARGTDDVRVGPSEEDIDDAREKALQARLRDNRHPLSNAEWQSTQRELVDIRHRREGRAYTAAKRVGGETADAQPSAGFVAAGSVGVSALIAAHSGILLTHGTSPRDPASMTRAELTIEITNRKSGIAAFKAPIAPPRAEVERLAALESELARRPLEAPLAPTAWHQRVDGPPLPKTPLPLGVAPHDMTTPVETLTRDQIVRQIDEMGAIAHSGARAPDALTAAAAMRLSSLQRRLAYLDATRAPTCDGIAPTYVDGVGSPPPDLTADRLIGLAELKGARFSDAEKQVLRTRFEQWKRAQCAATGADPTSYEMRQDPARSSFDGQRTGGVTIADRDAELSRRLAIIASVANNPLAALALARSWVTNESVEAAWRRTQLADSAAGAWAALAGTGQTARRFNTTEPTRVRLTAIPVRPTTLQKAQGSTNWESIAPFVGQPVSKGVPPGYSLVERGGRQILRRATADDARWPPLHVDRQGRIQVGPPQRLSVPGALRRALGLGPAHHQGHHVVPDQVVRDHPLFLEARRRPRPYNVDQKSNGAYLPDAPGYRVPNAPELPVHNGAHPKYTMLAVREANLVQQRLIERYGSLRNVPDDVLENATVVVEARMRKILSEWTTTTGERLE